jgi:trans-aconitate 2-methyltransferase
VSWDPTQYLKFAQPRLRPAIDLLNRVQLEAPRQVYDLGCGAGNVTALLAARWPQAHLCGVDNSESMLAEAARSLPAVQWRQQSLDQWHADVPADLIYSNAALHWLGQHERLFPALLDSLRPGGVLAVQMPRNFAAPSHTLIGEVARDPRWRERLEPLLQTPPLAVQEPAFYYGLLQPQTLSLDIGESEYLQALSGEDPVKEWTKGTALVPYLQRLLPAQQVEFERQYAKRLRAAYPPRADGVTLFPFRRLFLVARSLG